MQVLSEAATQSGSGIKRKNTLTNNYEGVIFN